MKKFFVFAVVVGGLAAFTACKKDHTCSCTTTFSGTITGTVTADTLLTDMKKGDAETECDSYEGEWTVGADSWSTACELK